MPTFRQVTFIRRALESLQAQTWTDWELIVVDDGSPDETEGVVAGYLGDERIRYYRLPRNGGLGAALNFATEKAGGRYLAYLPSDDVYYPEHLAQLVSTLEADPDCYLAYGGLRWAYNQYGPTLQGEDAVGREAEVLTRPPRVTRDTPLSSGNILALVQVMHRRDLEGEVRWATREEVVSDTLEANFWRALLVRGAQFSYTGALTCEWVEHAHQRHKLIAGPGSLTYFRRYHGIGREEWINWQPSRGPRLDERARYHRFAVPRILPRPGALKILLVGSLGFNPERIVAFEEQGHKLYGLWIPEPEVWDGAGPLPFGNIEDIPYDAAWPERVRAIQPDVIYALLNWQALALIVEVLDAQLDIPLVFHFKESPFTAQERGLWPHLFRALTESSGQIFINEEVRTWFQLATGGLLDSATSFILDGDLPKIEWMSDEWAPKLSEQDGEIHTVCAGRPLGLDPFEALAHKGIHVHFYGDHFHEMHPTWIRNGLRTGYLHLHPTVEPWEWVRKLSQYDAAWFHIFDSANGGDLRRANWDDLNLPARLGTYAAAGLPWIMKDNKPSRVALQQIARRHEIGIFFTDFDDLGAQLHDHSTLSALAANMRAARHLFAFDTHVSDLVAFFREAIRRHEDGSDQ
ncbi:MAG: glycosyltransferase family 2 protein [Chloroflexota bacterium]|nr:glycosyltransferase family 2 protein [Chloroflexota bacterium]